ncbi:MAG: TonB-dependent receptor [Bacteroidales bacterium]|nr:TonB-dependent receptor [Bacteroidales bacterium]
MKKNIILLSILLIFQTTLFSHSPNTANITGHTIDRVTGEHLPFVSIAIRGTTLGKTTGATGHFLLTDIPAGEHILVASFMGYERVEKSIVAIAGQTIEVNFELEPQALELSGVVITGSRNEIDRRESATVVGVLSSRSFDAVGATRLSEVLSFQPGLRLENTCIVDGAPSLRINGLGGQYTQILINSRPIFSSLASVYGLEQLPVGMIERVEVIRGGGSALYGSNAVAGVVNIITREPLRNSFAISNQTGIFGRGLTDINTTLNGSFVTDDFQTGAYLFAVANNRDAYDRSGDGFTEAPRLRSETFGFKAHHNLTNQSRLTLEYHRMHEFRRGGNMLDKPAHEADLAEQLNHRINGGSLTYNRFSRDYRHRFNAFASAQHIRRESFFGACEGDDFEQYGFQLFHAGDHHEGYGRTNDFTFVVGAQYTYSLDNFLFMPAQITAGIEYIDNNLEDHSDHREHALKQHARSFGTFIQNEWRNERFSLLIGGRLDRHNLMNNVVFSPRANTRFALNNHITLRASYAAGFRAPQIDDEDLHIPFADGLPVLIEMAEDLKPEFSNSFNFSVDLNKTLGRVSTNFLIDAFYTNIRNVFALELAESRHTPGQQVFQRVNEEGAVVQGLNFELTLGLTSRFIANVGFTVQSARYKEPYEWADDVDPIREMLRAPNQYGYITLSYTPTRRLTISATATYTGSMLVPHLEGYINHNELFRTPSFFDAGFRIAYEFQLSRLLRMQASAGMRNIFDQFQSTALNAGRLRDSGFVYGPAMPRMVYFGVRFLI